MNLMDEKYMVKQCQKCGHIIYYNENWIDFRGLILCQKCYEDMWNIRTNIEK
jgi:formylmethanofuran dehydrogenase subunit E